MSARDKVVVITGASSGIGEALAREYAGRGARLALLARRMERLDALCRSIADSGGQAFATRADVTSDGEIEAAIAEAESRYGRVDVVIANAGFSVSGPFEKLSLDDYRRQFETNVFGVLRTAYAALEPLKRSRGSLAAIGSVSGYLSVPGTTPYSMSKYAVRALCEGLWAELARHGIAVTHVGPGFVASEIRQVDNAGVLQADRSDFVPRWLTMSCETAARHIATGIERRRREVIVTGHGKLAVTAVRHTPGLFFSLARRMQQRAPK
jgi:short-subunit dehydrogenase